MPETFPEPRIRTYTQAEADRLVKIKSAEFFPNQHYLFIGKRDEKGYMHAEEIFMRGKDENFHLCWSKLEGKVTA